jgi:hypothetical protein
VSGKQASGAIAAQPDRPVALQMDDFAWETVEEESARLGVSVEELVAFSVLYYLADVDSGRMARLIGRSPYPRSSKYKDDSRL